MRLKLYLKSRYVLGSALFLVLGATTLGTTVYGLVKLAKAGNPQAKTIIARIRQTVRKVEAEPVSTPQPSVAPGGVASIPSQTNAPKPTKPPFRFLTSLTNDLFGTPLPTPFINNVSPVSNTLSSIK